jgi:lysozyme
LESSNNGVIPVSMDKVITALKADEQFRRLPYFDSRGILTLGYGFNLYGAGLTQAESLSVLTIRTWNVYMELLKALPWLRYTDDARQGVLINMAYNLGTAGELKFHVTLGDVERKNYDAAAQDMLKSAWANQVGDRARRLSEQMRLGVWL